MFQGFLGGTFSNFSQISLLEKKISDTDYPLEEFLKDDSAILCVESMGKKVEKYLNSERIKKLIKLVTKEPEEEDQLRGHKFPYVACEILKSNCPFISKRFVLNEQEYDEEFPNINIDDEKEIDFDFSNEIDKEFSKLEERISNMKANSVDIDKQNNENTNNLNSENKNKDEKNEIEDENSDKTKKNEDDSSKEKDGVNDQGKNKEENEIEKNNNDIKNKEEINNSENNEKEIQNKDNNTNEKEEEINDNKKNEDLKTTENIQEKKDEENKEEKEPKEEKENKEEKDNEVGKELKEEKNIDNKEEKELNTDNKNLNEIKEEEQKIEDKDDIKENKEKLEVKKEEEKNILNDNNLESKDEKEKAGKNNIEDNTENDDKSKKDQEKVNGDKDKIIKESANEEEQSKENNNKDNKNINNENEVEINLKKKDDSLEDEIGNIYSNDKSNDKKSKPKKIYENKPNNEYLDLLLNFVMEDKDEFNYVLSGYFANVIITLLTKYPSQILKYLYTVRKDALRKIVFHSHQKAFSILSLKLLNLENYILVDRKIENSFKEISTESIDFRNGLIAEIIKSISLEGIKDDKNEIKDDIDLEAKFSLIFEMINENNKIVKYLVFNNDVYSHIFNILDTDLYNNDNNSENNEGIFDNKYTIYALFIILTTRLLKTACSNYLISYPNEFDLNSIKKAKKELTFSENMIITFGKILKNNFLPKKPTLILEKCSTIPYEGLGMLNIKIILLVKEMMNFMKQLPKQFDSILIRNNFCQRSIDYFFKYQWNNIYHIQFVEFFNMYLSEEEKHKELTEFLFENIKFHEILINYLNQDNIDEKDIEKIVPKQRLKFTFKSGKTINSGVFAHVIDIIYKIQAISGLDICTEEEKSELKIKNYGEFEFSKDEKSNKLLRKINISNNIQNILKKSKLWNEIIKSTVIPLIKKYETQLCKEEEKKGGEDNELDELDINNLLPKRNSMGTSNYLFQQLISIIKKETSPKRFSLPLSRNDKNENKVKNDKTSIREKLLSKVGINNEKKIEDDEADNNKEENEEIKARNKDEKTNDSEENNKYNDTNFWEVKNTLPEEIKREVDKKTNIIFNYNPATYDLYNKDASEEDELLSIAMGLEQNEKTEKNKKTMYIMPGKLKPINLKAKRNPVQSLYNSVKPSKNENIEEYSHKNKDKINILEQKEEEKDTKQNEKEQNKQEEKKDINENLEKDDDKVYNDVNYWNTGNYLNEKEMEDCLKDL